ncbi:10992_t:CDS:2 [Racocetra fulgida]|uniref:10992_t:CDS:1 n=1 Tax=Racocetra fulgida TaxID=60492 RepID=A0A9N9FLM4_9GLOM|nr:10992_t:CDS:2 [Racocetra fulgida]
MEEVKLQKVSHDGEAVKAIKDCFSGTVGGIAQVLVGQRLQTQPTPKPGQPPLYSSMLDCVRKTSIEGLQVQITPTQSSASTQAQLYSGPIDCIKKIYSSYGIRGIYKGQVISMVREFQGFGGYFFVYEYLLQNAMKKENKNRDQIASWKLLLYGATAGYGMWIPVYPIDSVKSKIQTDGFTPETRQYKGSIDCFVKVYRKEGVRGFFKGFGTCMLRAAPVNASTFLAYEFAMRSIEKF